MLNNEMARVRAKSGAARVRVEALRCAIAEWKEGHVCSRLGEVVHRIGDDLAAEFRLRHGLAPVDDIEPGDLATVVWAVAGELCGEGEMYDWARQEYGERLDDAALAEIELRLAGLAQLENRLVAEAVGR